MKNILDKYCKEKLSIGLSIKALRKTIPLTTAELSKKADVNEDLLIRIEDEKQFLIEEEVIEKIAIALGVDLETLIFYQLKQEK